LKKSRGCKFQTTIKKNQKPTGDIETQVYREINNILDKTMAKNEKSLKRSLEKNITVIAKSEELERY
jgi:hypothetical protein